MQELRTEEPGDLVAMQQPALKVGADIVLVQVMNSIAKRGVQSN